MKRRITLCPTELSRSHTLFLAALEATERDAIAKLSMHNREHVVLIRPSSDALILHTLFYADELNEANRVKSPDSRFSSKELSLAKNLVEHLQAAFKPAKFSDTYRENVEKMVRAKARGKSVHVEAPARKAPVIDLMRALKESIAKAGHTKPVKAAKSVQPQSARRRRSWVKRSEPPRASQRKPG